jgi:predicted dehydrogenase
VTNLPLRLGVIGCGDVAITRYLPYLARVSPFVIIAACADQDAERTRRVAAQFALTPRTPDEVLTDETIDLVLNLTPPQAHRAVNTQALENGKHVYSEKPFATTVAEAREQQTTATRTGCRLASAPDTILGPNIQLARSLIDEGRLGRPFMASINFVTADRSWHPNPEFFYHRGGGPVLDEGPYFLTALVALLGPIREITAGAATFRDEITVKRTDGTTTVIRPQVPTSYAGILTLASGVLVTLMLSFDVRGTTAPPLEIYGEDGTLRLGFPGYYNGPVRFGTLHDHITEVIEPSWETAVEDARGIGVEEFAQAIASDTPSRLEGDFPLHILEVMEAIGRAAETGARQQLETTTERPAPYSPEENPRNRLQP